MKKATSRYLLNNKHNSQVAAAKVVFGINIRRNYTVSPKVYLLSAIGL